MALSILCDALPFDRQRRTPPTTQRSSAFIFPFFSSVPWLPISQPRGPGCFFCIAGGSVTQTAPAWDERCCRGSRSLGEVWNLLCCLREEYFSDRTSAKELLQQPNVDLSSSVGFFSLGGVLLSLRWPLFSLGREMALQTSSPVCRFSWPSAFFWFFVSWFAFKCLTGKASSCKGSRRQELSLSRGSLMCFLSPSIQQNYDRRVSLFC